MENSIYRNTKKYNSASWIFVLLSSFYLLWRTPIVGFYTNTYLAMLILIAFCGLMLFLENRWTAQAIFFIFTALLLALFDFAGDMIDGKSIIMSIWDMFLAIFPIIVGSILVTNRMFSVIRKIVPITIGIYLITAITTFIGLLRFPGASRLLAADPLAYIKFYPLNIGGFGFIYSLVLLHPLAVFILRKMRKLHYAIPFSICAFACIIASEYAMAVLLYIVSLTAYALPIGMHPPIAKRYIKRLFIMGTILVIFIPLILSFLSQFEFFGSMSEKFFDVSRLLQGEAVQEEGGVAARQNVYQKSLKVFLEHPIIGAKIYKSLKSGGHSYVLDTLANWGIIGFSFILIFFSKMRKFYNKLFTNNETYYCVNLFLIMVFILWALNPKIWWFEIGFIGPIFLYYIENIEDMIIRGKRRR